MSAVTATHTKHAHLGNHESEMWHCSQEKIPYYYHKKWELRLHSAGVAGPGTVHFSIYAIFLVSFGFGHFTRTSTRRK